MPPGRGPDLALRELGSKALRCGRQPVRSACKHPAPSSGQHSRGEGAAGCWEHPPLDGVLKISGGNYAPSSFKTLQKT